MSLLYDGSSETEGSLASTTSASASSISSKAPSLSSSASAEAGLSTGTSVGIGVGVAAGVIIVLAMLWWFIKRCRAAQKAASTGKVDSQEAANAAFGYKQETDSRPIHEAANTSKPVEMEGGGRWELDGGWQGVEIGHEGRSAT